MTVSTSKQRATAQTLPIVGIGQDSLVDGLSRYWLELWDGERILKVSGGADYVQPEAWRHFTVTTDEAILAQVSTIRRAETDRAVRRETNLPRIEAVIRAIRS